MILSSLIKTYHLTPTFAPLQPAQLDDYIHPILAPSTNISTLPRPSTLYDLSTAHRLLEEQGLKFHSPSSSLLSIELDQPKNYYNTGFLFPSSSLSSTSTTLASSPLQSHTQGAEPPLRLRVRTLIDTLHGTTQGGLAGYETVQECGERAEVYKEGMERAKRELRERERGEEGGWEEAWKE